MVKLYVENKSAIIARKFVLGFCGNLFIYFFYYFLLNLGFLIDNAPLKYYFDFLHSFRFRS